MYTPLIIERKTYWPRYRYSGNFKLVKKIEDLNEFWAVLKTQNRFMQGMVPWTGRLLLDCYLAGNQRANFQLNKYNLPR
jgi:hypothetical protein